MENNTRQKIKQIQSDLSSVDNIIFADTETLKYATKPIGKAILRNKIEDKRPIEHVVDSKGDTGFRCKPSDRIICKKCGKEFVRSNRTAHKRTKMHQLYEQLGDKVTNLLLDNKI